MSIKVACPFCDLKVEADDSYRGTEVICPGCGKIFIFGSAITPPPPRTPAVMPPIPSYTQPNYNQPNYNQPPNTSPSNNNQSGDMQITLPRFFSLETFVDFLTFRLMIFPKLIIGIYILGVVAALIAGIASFLNEEIFFGLILVIVGPVAARIICEILVVFFAINDSLRAIRKKVLEQK